MPRTPRQTESSQTGMKFHLIRIIYLILRLDQKIHTLVVKTLKSIYQERRSSGVKRVGVLEILVNTSAAKNGQRL